MCGIAGTLVFSESSFRITDSYLTRMRDTMVHRGPDGGGNWISPEGRVGLAHRRLSIIDLSTSAAQPMSNDGQTVWISFNGEIYNHGEIRKELESLGKYRWKTDHSDTEVIVHAFTEWGIDCIHKFRGMFAIAIWDAAKEELWLVRDRIGIKPLYYSIHDGRIVFASEIKALLTDPRQKREVDEESFFHYLSFLTSPAPHTLFQGIRKLPSSTWMRINSRGEIREHRYWDPLDHPRQMEGLTEKEMADRILAELRVSVQLRKVSDVPVGVFLSGGIDSSTNAALFSEGEKGVVKTFTIGYEGQYDSYTNELGYARTMAQKVHAEHHEKLLTVEDLLDFLPEMIRLQDEPIADPVCVPVYYVSKLAKDHGVTVCQVGEGADELFWGYPNWKRMLNRQNFLDGIPVPHALWKLGHSALRWAGRGQSNAFELLRRHSLGQPIFWGGAEAFNEEQKRALLSERLRKKFKNRTSWEALAPIRKRYEEKAVVKSNLNWMTYLDLNLRLPELLLMRVDKMSMGVSLEGRVPFLDYKFVEMAMSIPESVKTKNGDLKYILKKAVRGLIPDELIDRKKQGFGVPVYEWFFGKLGKQARIELMDFCDQTDFLDKKHVASLFEGQPGHQLWYLLNFSMWWKHFVR